MTLPPTSSAPSAHAHALALALALAHELDRTLALAHELDRTLALASVRDRDVEVALDRACDLARDLDLDLDEARGRDLARDLDRAVACAVARARDRLTGDGLAHDLDLAFDITDVLARTTQLLEVLDSPPPDIDDVVDGLPNVDEIDEIDDVGPAGAGPEVTDALGSPPGRVTLVLLATAARRLPLEDQQRYIEEWKAESYDQPQSARWAHGLRLLLRARATAQALRWRPASGLDRQRPW